MTMSEKIGMSEADAFIKEHDGFLILSHANPDGDTLGCAFALCRALQKLGKKARNICADEISHRYDFMKRASRRPISPSMLPTPGCSETLKSSTATGSTSR